jgi:hypothetical protein
LRAKQSLMQHIHLRWAYRRFYSRHDNSTLILDTVIFSKLSHLHGRRRRGGMIH